MLSHGEAHLNGQSDGDDNIVCHPRPQQLPNEIVSLIISHLSETRHLYECALVSMSFHAISNPLVWANPTLMDSSRFLGCISDASPQRLETLGQYIRTLRLNDHHWTDTRLLHLLPYIPHLQNLSIHPTTSITDTSFQHLPYHCQHLTSLKLVSTQLSHVSFTALGQHCPQLGILQWYVQNPQLPAWLAALKACPLETLQIYSQDEPLDEHLLTLIQSSFDQLTLLRIDHLAPDHMNSLLLGDNNHWPRLTTLDLSPCSAIDDDTLIAFLKSHPHLQVVRLFEAKRLTDTSVEAMATWLPRLTEVTLTKNENITAAGVRRQLIQNTIHLASVHLRFCRCITPQQFPELASTYKHGLVIDLDQNTIEKIKQVANRY